MKKNLRVALKHFLSLEEHSAFYENYIEKQEIKTSTDLDESSPKIAKKSRKNLVRKIMESN